jgi:hypothetical protein
MEVFFVHNYEISQYAADVSPASQVKVILLGGPPDLPTEARLQWVSRFETRIKICYYGGYEHFDLTPGASADGLSAFHWTGRTKVAE